MRKFLRLITVPLLLWGLVATAQTRTIKGQVVSATDGKAVAGATISVNGPVSYTHLTLPTKA